MSAPCPVFGFVLDVELANTLTPAEARDLHRAFSTQLIEPRGLICADRLNGHRWTLEVRSEASQATDADRCAAEAWAREQPEIVGVTVGPLVDFASAA